MKTTEQAAKALGISRMTLQTWIREGTITAPKITKVYKWRVRLWSTEDIQRVKQELKRRGG